MLFHVTANSDWSNLPLSGLFVEMLRRVVTLGPSQVAIATTGRQAAGKHAPRRAGASVASASALPPIQTLDGFGHLDPAAAPRGRRSRRTRSTPPCPDPTIRPAITARPARRAPST